MILVLKISKINVLLGFISFSFLLFITGPSSPLSREKRRLNLEEKVEKYYNYYNMILDEDVSEGMREMQRIVRIRQKCELPSFPEEPKPSENDSELDVEVSSESEPKSQTEDPDYEVEFWSPEVDGRPKAESPIEVPEYEVQFRRPDEQHHYGIVTDNEFSFEHDDSHLTYISCVSVHYRFPASSMQGIKNSIVFGILSGRQEETDLDFMSKHKRDAIRNTWGQGNKVFFIVAGKWNYIEDEYHKYNDIIWVDQPEIDKATIWDHKGSLPFKTEIFLTVMSDHVIKENSNVEYFFKTDDDYYIDVDLLQERINVKNKDDEFDPLNYWGQCIEKQIPSRDEEDPEYTPYEFYPYNFFPTYCLGNGYLLSKNFVKCAIDKAHTERSIYLRNEAQTVGLLAEKCGIQPSKDSLQLELDVQQNLSNKVAVRGNIRSLQEMITLHEHVTRN
jgi:hypothetical protein